jgi:hypothetical protein
MPGPRRRSASLPGASLGVAAWSLASRWRFRRFQRLLGDGPAVNSETLRTILRAHAHSEFGVQAGFASLARAPDIEKAWQQATPVADYADFAPAIQRMANGAENVLIAGRPSLFVSTSGTTGDPKLFPVTRPHQNAALKYIALTLPAARAAAVPGLGFRQPTTTLMVASKAGRQTPAGIPVGNPSGAGIRRILALAPPFWVYPPTVLTVADHPTALYLHALFALRAADLGCIEAIFCSHIVNWMGLIQARRDELVRDIAQGTLSSLILDDRERRELEAFVPADPARARQVSRALDAGSDTLMSRLWPQLKVLSCVVSGAFAVSAPRLRQLAGAGPAFYTTCFGATEGMVGINVRADAPEHYVMALGACHHEFLPMADEGTRATGGAVSMAEVEQGGLYEVVLTNRAGLYRYRLGDVVRIVDRLGATPAFAFHQRRGNVVDLVGEKTTEEHLRAAVACVSATAATGMAAVLDYSLHPDITTMPYRYVLYLEFVADGATRRQPDIAAAIEAALMRHSPAYATLARLNGRLGPMLVREVRPGTFATLLGTLQQAGDGRNPNQVKVPKVLKDDSMVAALQAATIGQWSAA